MFEPYVLALSKYVQYSDHDGNVTIRGPAFNLDLGKVSPLLNGILETLKTERVTEDALADKLLEGEADTSLATLYYYLDRLARFQVLAFHLVEGDLAIACQTPICPQYRFKSVSVPRDKRHVLSKFCFIHTEVGTQILESPLAFVRIELLNWRSAALLNALAAPRSIDDLSREFPDIRKETICAFVSMLHSNSMLSEADSDGLSAEEKDKVKRQWEFHDLLFHSRSRFGRHEMPCGATYPFAGEIEPLPVCKAPMSDERVPLLKPDMDKLLDEDYPFTLVLEERHSVREYDDRPLTVDQLGEFLYRSARCKEIKPPDPSIGALYETTVRPYPGGGAAYELELYITVHECQGLERGIYYYDAVNHELHRLCGYTKAAQALLKSAETATAQKCFPRVLISLAARFQRLAWKYQGMAYSTVLKDVGTLYQTMYLVATAMDLAPCGLGNGSADELARAVGLDYLVESGVGEFMLGRKKI